MNGIQTGGVGVVKGFKGIYSGIKSPQSEARIIKSVENGKTSLNSIQEKGNYAEIEANRHLVEEKGYTRLDSGKVTNLHSPPHKGLDGVYLTPDGKYVIVEVKYGSARLSMTRDGLQMDDTWIMKNNRLIKAVGKEVADKILLKGYSRILVQVGRNGSLKISNLDAFGKIIK